MLASLSNHRDGSILDAFVVIHITYFYLYHERYSKPPSMSSRSQSMKLSRSLDGRNIYNRVNRRINSLKSRRSSALTLPITATVIRILSGDRQIRISKVILTLNLIADVLLDARIERLVIRVLLNAERPVARDVLNLWTEVPVRWPRRLHFRVPGRAIIFHAPVVLCVDNKLVMGQDATYVSSHSSPSPSY